MGAVEELGQSGAATPWLGHGPHGQGEVEILDLNCQAEGPMKKPLKNTTKP